MMRGTALAIGLATLALWAPPELGVAQSQQGAVAGSGKNQMSRKITRELKRAGVSDKCVNTLTSGDVMQINVILNSNRQQGQKRQAIRTYLQRYCRDL